MPNLVDVPREYFSMITYTHLGCQLIQTRLAKKYDILPDTYNYNAYVLSINLLTTGH